MAPTAIEIVVKSSALIEKVSKARARACSSNSWTATSAHPRYASVGERSISRNPYAQLFPQDHDSGRPPGGEQKRRGPEGPRRWLPWPSGSGVDGAAGRQVLAALRALGIAVLPAAGGIYAVATDHLRQRHGRVLGSCRGR